MYAKFVETCLGEVRRIYLPRTSVNKSEKKGRGIVAPALLLASVVVGAQPFLDLLLSAAS